MPQLYNAAIMNPRVQYAKTSDGVNIAYAVFGAGPVVVFASTTWGSLHGAQSNTSLWAALENYLVASDRSVVLYDIRGAGSSDRDITDFSLAARVLDLEAVVERLALDSFPLIGAVQGCPTAIAYAAARPEKVSHLIL
jgi:pimeloyl-ACP methyl ester carboxylesterase